MKEKSLVIPLISQTRRVAIKQVQILLFLSVATGLSWTIVADYIDGIAAFCGGLSVSVGQLVFIWSALRFNGARQAGLIKSGFKQGLHLKWSATLIFAALALAKFKLPPLPFLTTFCVMVLVSASIPVMFSKK
ncbi:hypothetical protein DU002_15280 [Corallincola holothuriorum]|uniref:ATP synthase protein I n=1 Tax=Corallincola holothuriorum TaxID=2282215 RepID=A0A368N827_9GAMM|nr:hypothetical protein DU002_15280 [Corallincola holothuriorum]